MDSDWRNSTLGREGYYTYPNTSAFANFSEWAHYKKPQMRTAEHTLLLCSKSY